MHSKFFNFMNIYFKFLISNSHTLKGLKFIIAGKLKGKPRSNTYTCTAGRVPIQTLSYAIDYAKYDAHTVYGVFGIKLWIYK